jgi:hypothetical protein
MAGINPNLPIRYGSTYKSNTSLAANTPETVFTPAANARGAIVWDASFVSYGASAAISGIGFVAKVSAPTTPIDGDVICQADSIANNGSSTFVAGSTKGKPFFIPAGRGLYFIAGAAEGANVQRQVKYDLL